MIEAAGLTITLDTMIFAGLGVVLTMFGWALLQEGDFRRAASRTGGDLIPTFLGMLTVVGLLLLGLEAEVLGFPAAILGMLGFAAVVQGINLSVFLAVFVATVGTAWGVLRENGKWVS